MRILVTGAAGFIGSHLAEMLADDGHEVVGIDCFSPYYSRALKELNAADVRAKGVELLELDLAEDPLEAALDGVEVVCHLAAQPGISAITSFEDYLRNNLIATRRLAETAMDSPTLKCFINVATSSVYGKHATDTEETAPKPTSYYGVTKLAAEQLVMAYQRDKGFPACSLRLFSVYGPRERPEKLYPKLIGCILADTEFPLFEGSLGHTRSFTYVGDILEGFRAALGHLDACVGEIFNIGSDAEFATAHGIEIVEGILDRKARFRELPPRPGDQLCTCANIDKARRILGYNPTTAPEDGLRTEVEWYKQKVFGKIE